MEPTSIIAVTVIPEIKAGKLSGINTLKITKEEVETLIKIGFKTISLGKRILRTETAAVYALSALSLILESGEK